MDHPRASPFGYDFQLVAASQANQKLGNVGKQGDHLAKLIILPATTTPGAVQIKDGTGGTPITIMPAGTVLDLTPIEIDLCTACQNAGWYVVTGASVSVLAVGWFS
jgi:hypothetical protein